MCVTVSAVGDVMLGDHPFRIGHGVASTIRKKGPTYPFLHVANVLRKADIRFCNLESVLSDVSEEKDILRSAQMRGDPIAVEGLTFAGFQIVSLANNHIMDHGEGASLQTIQLLQANGIRHVGLSEPHEPQHEILTAQGYSIAFLAYCFVGSSSVCGPCDARRLFSLRENIRRARQEADFVAVSVHWGLEFMSYPSPNMIALAHRIVDYGADIILGHHPHVLQRVERYRNKLIAYSLGNFVFDMLDPTRESMILQACLHSNGRHDYDEVPIHITDDYQPVQSNDEKRQQNVGNAPFDGLISPLNELEYEEKAKFLEHQYRITTRKYAVMNAYKFPPKYLIQLLKHSLIWHLSRKQHPVSSQTTVTEDVKSNTPTRDPLQ